MQKKINFTIMTSVRDQIDRITRTYGDNEMIASIDTLKLSVEKMQELLGHKDVSTTMIYTHVLNRGGLGVTSPLDRMR